MDAQDQRVTISFDYGRADKEWTFRWDKHCDYIILLCLRGDESITAFRLERNVIDLIQNQKGPWIVRVMDENGSFSLIHGDVRLPVTPMG